MRKLTKIFLFAISVAAIVCPAGAFELRQHEIKVNAGRTANIPLTNTLDLPIIVRVTAPDGLQVFPRRLRLLPGERQILKARSVGDIESGSRMSFTYAVDREAGQGVHARVSLRLPVSVSSQ